MCTRPDFELMHDLGGGEEGNFDAVEALHHAAIAALMPGLAQGEAGALEQMHRRCP